MYFLVLILNRELVSLILARSSLILEWVLLFFKLLQLLSQCLFYVVCAERHDVGGLLGQLRWEVLYVTGSFAFEGHVVIGVFIFTGAWAHFSFKFDQHTV